MQFNYYFLKALSKSLETCLVGMAATHIFSQNKDEMIMSFSGTDKEFIIKANLDSETSLLSFPEKFARARKNSVDLFDPIKGLKVITIKQFENERSFSIKFENQFELLFKLHGRHSNLILYHNESVLSLFKNNIQRDSLIQLNMLDRILDQSDDYLVNVEFDLAQCFPTFDRNIKNCLTNIGFYESNDPTRKLELLHSILSELNDNFFYVTESRGKPQLMLFKPESYVQSFEDPIAASNFLARHFFTNYGFTKLKAKLLSQVKKEMKKGDSYLRQAQTKLAELNNKRGYDELANILMANLHVSPNPNSKEIELFDFYSDKQIKIKIKPNQSLQQNAEAMYRKAKNQTKEIEVLERNIHSKQTSLAELKLKEQAINSTDDFKSLKAYDAPDVSNKDLPTSPFMEFTVEGFQVYVGKNARNNDLLTQKFARKDDLWLHARDVSGSHVVIKNPAGINVPMYVVEKVAQVAAWYSKRKSDTLCPVIYTPKKFVRKPKGSLPGQVVLSKEQVVLVKPENIR